MLKRPMQNVLPPEECYFLQRHQNVPDLKNDSNNNNNLKLLNVVNWFMNKMCSIDESELPSRRESGKKMLGRRCMKCKEEQAVLITRVNDAFCRSCFQVYVTHKFRAAIGKTKLVRDAETVLVAFSGGPASSALLHLIQEGLSLRAHKKLRFKPGIIFIDEGVAVGLSTEERLGNCERIQAIMQDTGFPCYMKSLEEGIDLDSFTTPRDIQQGIAPEMRMGRVTTDWDAGSVSSDVTASTALPDFSPSSSPAFRGEDEDSPQPTFDTDQPSKFQVIDAAEGRLTSILDAIKFTSTKEDFIRNLRHNLILEIARHCGYTKVMLGNCGTQLAVRLLADMATGRGGQAAMNTTFADRRYEDIMFLRPLRDFSSKEIAMYNTIHGIEPVFTPTLTTKEPMGASIDRLTEAFVTGLQAEYPATVSNIMRTGEKLESCVVRSTNSYCAMCQAPLDTNVGASSALSAVEFSQRVSRHWPGVEARSPGVGEDCCGEGDGSCRSTHSARPTTADIMSSLCYGCRLTVRDMDDVYRLPEYVHKDVAWRTRRARMKDEVQDFLIEDS